jgi:hypothetical protein
MFIELSTVTSDDDKKLHNVLILVCLLPQIKSLDLDH